MYAADEGIFFKVMHLDGSKLHGSFTTYLLAKWLSPNPFTF